MAKKKKTESGPIGVVLVTHTDYGARLLAAAEFIVGAQPFVRTVSVDGSNEVGETVERLEAALAEADEGGGVIFLTDMFGGTPTNLSLSLLGKGNLEVVTGVNLPMLLKVIGGRDQKLDELAAEAKTAGQNGIVVAGELLRSKVKERK